METSIEFTRIKNDVNGNPRYVCHFLDLLNESEQRSIISVSEKYVHAIKRAKQLGGKKYHTKSYGGGIVFQSYNVKQLEQDILKLVNG